MKRTYTAPSYGSEKNQNYKRTKRKKRKMKRLRKVGTLLSCLAVLLVAVGCAAETEPATNVTETQATLQAKVRCSGATGEGVAYFQVRNAGPFLPGTPPPPWERVGVDTLNGQPWTGSFTCPGPGPFLPATKQITLQWARTDYRICMNWVSAPGTVICEDSVQGDAVVEGDRETAQTYDQVRPAQPPSPECTDVTPQTFQAAYNSAPANAVLCLASGNYGTFTGSLRSSPVTIKEQAGAAASMSLDFNPASNITIDGLTIPSAELTDVRTKNITVRNSDFTGQTRLRTGPDNFGLQNSNVLFDSNVHHDWDTCSGCGDARVWLPERTNNPSGITIQNSEFVRGRSDGIQNGSNGTRILNNEFHDLPGDAEVHVDAIQLYGSQNTVIRGNWFHHLDGGVGVIMAADELDHEVIEDNVFGPNDGGRPWIDIYSDDGSQIVHNTFVDGACEFNSRCGRIALGAKSEDDPGFGTVIRDNLFQGFADGNRATWTATSNLITPPLPVYVGPPTTRDGFRLAPGSPGKGAASDGLDLGSRFP
jgi:hypothetical protein